MKHQTHFDQAWQLYLQGHDLQSILARFPNEKDDLEPMLTAALRLHAVRDLTASAEFRRTTRTRLLNRIQATPAAATRAAARPRQRRFPFRFALPQPLARNSWVSALLALAILLSGMTATTVAAQSALPGDVLYPVKLTSEDIQRRLSSDPLAQHITFSQKRLAEAQALQTQGRYDDIEKALALYQQELAQMIQLLPTTEVPPEAISRLQQQVTELENLDRMLPEPQQNLVEDSLKQATDVLQQVQPLAPTSPPAQTSPTPTATPMMNSTPMSGMGDAHPSATPEMDGSHATITPEMGGPHPTGTPEMGGPHPTGTPEMGGPHPTGTPEMGGPHPTGTPEMGGPHPSGTPEMGGPHPSATPGMGGGGMNHTPTPQGTSSPDATPTPRMGGGGMNHTPTPQITTSPNATVTPTPGMGGGGMNHTPTPQTTASPNATVTPTPGMGGGGGMNHTPTPQTTTSPNTTATPTPGMGGGGGMHRTPTPQPTTSSGATATPTPGMGGGGGPHHHSSS